MRKRKRAIRSSPPTQSNIFRHANFRIGAATVSCSMSGLISESQTGNRQLNRHEPTGVYLPVNNEEAYHALLIVTLALVAVLLQALGDIGLGQTNCGFLTIEQCRATLTGRSSFCVPNQFYNPHGPTDRTRNRQEGREVRAYAMPYVPYPWCAFLSDPGN
jgi:hypothetical protein